MMIRAPKPSLKLRAIQFAATRMPDKLQTKDHADIQERRANAARHWKLTYDLGSGLGALAFLKKLEMPAFGSFGFGSFGSFGSWQRRWGQLPGGDEKQVQHTLTRSAGASKRMAPMAFAGIDREANVTPN